MKDLFTGALGRLNNHGGSKIYTTPNTILVPPEYEIEIGEHGIFISCSLDGRLWLFEDRIIALKWNKEAGKMEYAASKSFSDENFVARGRDWILTDKSVIQITDSSPYIFHETHNENVTPMEHFYSLLPALDGFQIVKNFLIRKPNESYKNLMYPVTTDNIFLIPHGADIYGKISDKIGLVIITNEDNNYLLNIIQEYSTSDSRITGIAFIDDMLFGFQNDENNKGLCLSSQNQILYSFKDDLWNIPTVSGKIYFDMFTNIGLAIEEKCISLSSSLYNIECNTIAQWIAPNSEIHYVSDDMILSSFENTALATNLESGLYREILCEKALPLTATEYKSIDGEKYRLAIGIINKTANINKLKVTYPDTDNTNNLKIYYYKIYNQMPFSNTGFVTRILKNNDDIYPIIIKQSAERTFLRTAGAEDDWGWHSFTVTYFETKLKEEIVIWNLYTGEILPLQIITSPSYEVKHINNPYFPNEYYSVNDYYGRAIDSNYIGYYHYNHYQEIIGFIPKFNMGKFSDWRRIDWDNSYYEFYRGLGPSRLNAPIYIDGYVLNEKNKTWTIEFFHKKTSKIFKRTFYLGEEIFNKIFHGWYDYHFFQNKNRAEYEIDGTFIFFFRKGIAITFRCFLNEKELS